MKGPKKVADLFLKYLLRFTEDEVHRGDFDQGQSLNETKGVARRWFGKNEKKILKDLGFDKSRGR